MSGSGYTYTASSRVPVRPLSYENKALALPKELLMDYTNAKIYICNINGEIIDITEKMLNQVNALIIEKIKSNEIEEIIEDIDIDLEDGTVITIESGIVTLFSKLSTKQNVAVYWYPYGPVDDTVQKWLEDEVLSKMPNRSSVTVGGVFFNTDYESYGTLYKHNDQFAYLYTTSYSGDEWSIRKLYGEWLPSECITRATKADIDDLSEKLNNAKNEINNHKKDVSNPHSVNKSHIGLSNVDNTSDIDKPVSTAMQAALDNKQNIATHRYPGSPISAEYWETHFEKENNKIVKWLEDLLATMPDGSGVDVSGHFFSDGNSHYSYGTLYKHTSDYVSLYTTSYVDEEWRVQKLDGKWQVPEHINRATEDHTHDGNTAVSKCLFCHKLISILLSLGLFFKLSIFLSTSSFLFFNSSNFTKYSS